MKALIAIALLCAACNAETGRGSSSSGGGTSGGHPDLSSGSQDLSPNGGDGGGPNMSCLADAPDQAGCSCPQMGATRGCYPASADASTRNVGACKDGT